MTIDPEHECAASQALREDLGELLHDMKRMGLRRSPPLPAADILALFAAAPVGGGDVWRVDDAA